MARDDFKSSEQKKQHQSINQSSFAIAFQGFVRYSPSGVELTINPTKPSKPLTPTSSSHLVPTSHFCVMRDDPDLPSLLERSADVDPRSQPPCDNNPGCPARTPDIEKKYVHRIYDAIAPHFSSTRFAKWPKVAAFLMSLPRGCLVLDAGCGNGKYLGLNPDCCFVGCDISDPLIRICADKDHEVLVADAVNLPYRTGIDASISIAVLHHLSTEGRRRRAIEELVRVVKRGGLVLITVWAVEQEDMSLVSKWTPLVDKFAEEWIGPGSPRCRSPSSLSLESIPEIDDNLVAATDDLALGEGVGNGGKDQQEYFVPWHLPYHRAEIGGASKCALESGLAKRDDKKQAVVYNRYYHVFEEGELERLVSDMSNVVVVGRFFDKSNWCIVLVKTC